MDFTGLKSSSAFEEIVIEQKNENLVEINYSWIDLVRIRDKYNHRNQSNVSSWYFLNENILCTFSNSESAVAHVVKSLYNYLPSSFERLSSFEYWKENHLLDNDWFAKLTSIHVKRNPTPSDDREIKKINLKNINKDEYIEFFKTNLVTNLTFVMNDTIVFYIDTASVITFPDTIKEVEINSVLKNVVKGLSLNHA
jgi:hypothetical protein